MNACSGVAAGSAGAFLFRKRAWPSIVVESRGFARVTTFGTETRRSTLRHRWESKRLSMYSMKDKSRTERTTSRTRSVSPAQMLTGRPSSHRGGHEQGYEHSRRPGQGLLMAPATRAAIPHRPTTRIREVRPLSRYPPDQHHQGPPVLPRQVRPDADRSSTTTDYKI